MTTAPAIMYDGINSLAAGIAREFPSATRVAGYVNGLYAWSQAEWNLFPHATKVQITITASANAGDVLDVERGDATPAQCAAWIRMRKAAGLYRPTIYCNRSSIPAVRAGTGIYILGKDYDIWVADYTNAEHEVTAPGTPAATCAATQYESAAGYDVTAVYDSGWPHRKPPAPPAPPEPQLGQSATPHTVRTINVFRSGPAGFAGEFTTVAKTLLGHTADTSAGKETHLTLTVPAAGYYTVETTAPGCKASTVKVHVK